MFYNESEHNILAMVGKANNSGDLTYYYTPQRYLSDTSM